MRRKILYSIILVTILTISGFTAYYSFTDSYSCDGCNLVIISIEPLRADHVGAYGYERNTTPFIDSMAEESLVFTNAYTQSSHTFPALISVLTGLYPSQHGVTFPVAYSENYSQNLTMMTDALDEEGYETMAIAGKQSSLRPELNLDKNFDKFVFKYSKRNLSKVLESKEKDKFFLYYQDFTPHDPYIAQEEYRYIFSPTITSFNQKLLEMKNNLSEKDNLTPAKKYELTGDYYFNKVRNNETLRKHAIAQYDGMIRESDDSVRRVINVLEDKELEDNTIVVFTSLHGEMLGEHGKWKHYTHLENEVLEVPLIIKVPGEPPKKYDQPFELISLAPTLLDILEVDSKKFKQQAYRDSIKPFLKNGEEKEKRFVFAEDVNLKKNVLIDFKSNLKYFKNNQSKIKKVYNISGDKEEELKNNETREEMAEVYRNFLERASIRNSFTKNVRPYIIQ